ncbi:MAG: cytochrome c3 family protein [Candidatus Aminicenantales bacterium]
MRVNNIQCSRSKIAVLCKRIDVMKVCRIFLFGFILILSCSFSQAQVSSHLDWSKLPRRCASCHVGHGVPGTVMLPAAEEQFCFQCHGDFIETEKAIRTNRLSGTAKITNIRREFQKQSRHPVELTAERTQSYLAQRGQVFNTARAECLDCHRGHGVSHTSYSPGASPKRSTKDEREYEYQLCYRCHSQVNQLSFAQKDIKVWFETVNPSYHPIEASGKNSDVPSLKEPYNISSIINCTDCHNNSDLNGPRGPHGSNYEYILERNYNKNDFISESPQQYELCYKCHKRESILGDESFPYHSLHVVNGRTSCYTCHSSHGSQVNTHLIRYNEEIDPFRIQASSSGRLEFIDMGRFSGQCFLRCHGVDHNPKSYSRN